MTDTTQNKPTCCEKCLITDNFPIEMQSDSCHNASCICHTQKKEWKVIQDTDMEYIAVRTTTQTTPSEEWVNEYYDLCRELKYHDLVPRVRMKEFIEKTRTEAYEKGKNSREPQTFSMKKLQQEAYEKGVRDSLEVVEQLQQATPGTQVSSIALIALEAAHEHITRLLP